MHLLNGIGQEVGMLMHGIGGNTVSQCVSLVKQVTDQHIEAGKGNAELIRQCVNLGQKLTGQHIET